MIALYEKYKGAMPTDELIRFIGKSVARFLSVCYRGHRNHTRLEVGGVVIEEVCGQTDEQHEEFMNRRQKEDIAGLIEDNRLRKFFDESYEPSTDTIEIVERRITIRKNEKKKGKLRFNMGREHPTDSEIGQTLGMSKATTSRYRHKLIQCAVEGDWL